MDRIYETSLLLDFYGQLLTDRQYAILDLYYNNDYSLGEIAENFGISRQGVYDYIKRSRDILKKFEDKLGLVHRFVTNIEKARKAQELLRKIDTSVLNDEDRKRIECVEGIIEELINEKD